MTKATVIAKRVMKGAYDLDVIEAIVDHPNHGRLLAIQGFGGVGTLAGGAVRWRHGLVARLHGGDTFDVLDADWNEATTVLEAVTNGYDDSRPLQDWDGLAVENFATGCGLMDRIEPAIRRTPDRVIVAEVRQPHRYSLNAFGQAQVAEAVRQADKRELVDDAYFDDAEQAANDAFDASADAIIEVRGIWSVTGNPITIRLERDWFDAEPVEL